MMESRAVKMLHSFEGSRENLKRQLERIAAAKVTVRNRPTKTTAAAAVAHIDAIEAIDRERECHESIRVFETRVVPRFNEWAARNGTDARIESRRA